MTGNRNARETNKRTSAMSCKIADSTMTFNTGASGDGNISEYLDDLRFVFHTRYAMSDVVMQFRATSVTAWIIAHFSHGRRARAPLTYFVGVMVLIVIATKPRT